MQPYKLLLILGSLVLAYVAPSFAFAADDGARIFEEECSDCHNAKKKPLDNKHMTRAEWKEAISTMIEKDKLDPLPSQERISQLLDWLVATRGPAAAAASGAATDPGKNQAAQ